MWDDNDVMMKLLDNRQLTAYSYPRVCPACQQQNAHVYFHRFNGKQLGSGWAWCSNCGSYSHARYIIPEWWKNSHLIDPNLLSASPEYLDDMKDIIDQHFNSLISIYPCV